MSFSYNFKTLRTRNSYDLRTQPKKSTHGKENTEEAETVKTEGSEKKSISFSPELVDERTKPLTSKCANLSPYRDDGRLIESN